MQFEQLAPLPALLRLFRAGKFPLRQCNATLLRDDFYCFDKTHIVELLHEGENITRLVAPEAVVELAHCVHGKGRGLLPVEGTKTGIVLRSGFFQRDVSADDADDISLLLYELGEIGSHWIVTCPLSYIGCAGKLTSCVER